MDSGWVMSARRPRVLFFTRSHSHLHSMQSSSESCDTGESPSTIFSSHLPTGHSAHVSWVMCWKCLLKLPSATSRYDPDGHAEHASGQYPASGQVVETVPIVQLPVVSTSHVGSATLSAPPCW